MRGAKGGARHAAVHVRDLQLAQHLADDLRRAYCGSALVTRRSGRYARAAVLPAGAAAEEK